MGVANGRDWPVKLKERCENVGWTVTYTKSGHYKVQNPQGKLLFTFASTPTGAAYVERNAIAEARRHGLEKLEAATEKMRENDRLLRIAQDRAKSEEQLAKIRASYEGDEPSEPASSEVDDATAASWVFVDPEYHGPTGLPRRDGRPSNLRQAPSRELINGQHVVTSQPSTMTNIHGEYQTPQILELLLEDGRTAYLCNSPNAPDCTVWGLSGLSIRAHLKYHSQRMLAVRAAAAAEQARRELELELELIRRGDTTMRTPVPPKTTTAAAAKNGGDRAGALLANVEGILEQLTEAFATIIVSTANVQRQFEALRDALKKVADLAVTDEEVLAKAAKYEALAGTLKTLMQ